MQGESLRYYCMQLIIRNNPFKKLSFLFYIFLLIGCEMNSAFLAGVAEGIHKQQQINDADRVVKCKKYYSGDVVCTEYKK